MRKILVYIVLLFMLVSLSACFSKELEQLQNNYDEIQKRLDELTQDSEGILTFNLNGGNIDGETKPFDIKLNSNQNVDLPLPCKEGYTFIGWYVEGSDYANLVNIKINNNVTLVAKWQIKKSFINFETGVEGISIQSIEAEYQSSIQIKDYEISGYKFNGWFLDSDFTIPFDYNTMPANDITLFGDYQIITSDTEFPGAPGLLKIDDILITCNKEIVYLDAEVDGTWYWRLNIKNNTNKSIRIDMMQAYLYSLFNEYLESPAYSGDSAFFHKWFGTNELKPRESFDLGSGMGVHSYPHVYFFDYIISGHDDEGNVVKGTIRVKFSQDVDPDLYDPNTHNNGKGEDSVLDFNNVRYNADFAILVAPGVYWRPVNALGLPNLSKEEILAIGKNPGVLQEQIDSLYEALLYVSLVDFEAADDNKRIYENGINWEHHKPGEIAILSNEGCCATMSNLLNYLLKDDYDEVGFIAYSQSDGGGHVFNYIKEDDYYYFIDVTHYVNGFDYKALETGEIKDYHNSDFVAGNIHQVSNIDDYINYIMASYNDPPELFSMYQALNVLPIDGIRTNGKVEITYPEEYQNLVQIVYDVEGDNIYYAFKPGPTKFPEEWEPYNVFIEN